LLKQLLPLLAALLGACTTPPARPAGPLIAVDDFGDTVRLAAPATRVVSLSPATTELLFALGAGTRVVGRTRWCDYPPGALAVTNVGDGIPPNIEAVLAARPDLILLYLSPQNTEAKRRFNAEGIAVLQLAFDHLADVARIARLVGPLVGRALVADSLADSLTAALDRARVRADSVPDSARPRVLILAWDQPPIAIGSGSFQSEILSLAGGKNLFVDVPTPSATVSIEAIAARNPDLILVSDTGTPAFAARPEWRAVSSVREKRFVQLANTAFSRPSPRAPGLIDQLRAALIGASR
jgi:ABC-type Fe3+-hydroxamate transport system substrate-binding protein